MSKTPPMYHSLLPVDVQRALRAAANADPSVEIGESKERTRAIDWQVYQAQTNHPKYFKPEN